VSNTSTIYALSTPSGTGALALIRVSGNKAITLLECICDRKLANLEPNKSIFCRIKHKDIVIDEVVLTYFKGPHSFTGEDTIEISCHGSSFIIQQILNLLEEYGGTMAQPGEFSMRAFLNGKMDLSQAEAVADLIASENEASHSIAMNQLRGGFSDEIKLLREELINFASLIELELDFAEEDVEFANRKQLLALVDKINGILNTLINSFEYGNAIKNGIPVAIVGAPNAGKSTLLNALVNEEKAIVSAIPGTTRDVIEDTVTIEGIQFRFIDTAGIRGNVNDEIEKIGIERSFEKIEQAQIVLYCGSAVKDDNTTGENILIAKEKVEELKEKYPNKKIILVATKTDKGNTIDKPKVPHAIFISAKNKNVDELKNSLLVHVRNQKTSYNNVIVTNVRHLNALKKAQESLLRASNGLTDKLSGDLVAMDIRSSLHYLGEITGTISTEDLLGNIFSKFCIGK
jgi:tRNA modification GTPase